jgi:uncharacterized surface protein with fasciclin (FAS1) repeats
MLRMSWRRTALTGMVLSLAVIASACGSSKSSTSMSSTNSSMAPSTTMAMATQPTGAACSQIPSTGPGSVTGMSDVPVATAASNNPLLTTLVSAVKQAQLVDTLNSTGSPAPFTVFAPINSAFAKVPSDQLNALLANTAQLTKVLEYHVVPGRYSTDQLSNGQTLKTVEGDNLTINKAADGSISVNGSSHVVCANVPTANATVMLVDTVLMPPTSSMPAMS